MKTTTTKNPKQKWLSKTNKLTSFNAPSMDETALMPFVKNSRAKKKLPLFQGILFACTLIAFLFFNALQAQTSSNCVSPILTIDTDAYCEVECVKAYTGSSSHAFWLPELPGTPDYVFVGDGEGALKQFDNGTARLTGRLVNVDDPNDKWGVNVWYKDAKDWQAWQASNTAPYWKGNASTVGTHYTHWTYYLLNSGADGKKSKLTGQGSNLGAVLYLEHSSDFAFQVGRAANDKNGNYGASGWLTYSGVDANGNPYFGGGSSNGDINLDFCTNCSGVATITLDQSASFFTYDISPNTAIFKSGNQVLINGLCEGTYTLTITDAGGCVTTANFTISSDDLPQVNLGPNIQVCENQVPVTLDAGAGFATYSWTTTETTQTIDVSTSGTYGVEVTNNEGCSNQDIVKVTVGGPELTVNATDFCEVTCVEKFDYFNNYAMIMPELAGGNGHFDFENGTGDFKQFADGTARLTGRIVADDDATKLLDIDIWFTQKMTYAEWVAYYNGGQGQWKGQAGHVGDHYLNWAYYLIDSGADGMKSTMTGVDGGFFEGYLLYVEHKDDSPYAAQVGYNANDKLNDAYGLASWIRYMGTDNNGNPISGGSGGTTAQLADLNLDFCVDCSGQAVVMVETEGNFTYSITPEVMVTQNGNVLTISGLCEGDYELTVTDTDNGCASTTTIHIDMNLAPSVDLGDDIDEMCFEGGPIVLDAGAGGVAYMWNTGETTQTIEVSTSGTYSVKVTDAEGCANTDEVVVNITLAPQLDVDATDFCEVTCVEKFDYFNNYAMIMPELAGGNGHFDFEDGTGDFKQFADGTARLTGRIVADDDATKLLDIDIWFTQKMTYAEWVAFYNNGNGQWKGQASHVGDHYLNWAYYLIDSGADGMKSTMKGVDGGFFEGYLLYVEHKDDSPYAAQVGYNANDKLNDAYGLASWIRYMGTDNNGDPISGGSGGTTAQLADLNLDFCEDCTGTATVTVTANGSYTYTITPAVAVTQNGNDLTLTGLCPGNYEVSVTDADDCTTTETITIDLNLAPSVHLGADMEACGPTTLDAGAGFAAYAWSTGETTQTITVSTPAIYSVAVTDAEGCENTDEIELTPCSGGACKNITVTIDLDYYQGETNWEITDANGAVVASGGPYWTNLTVETVCLPDDACYTFSIYDDYGDGICCSHGYGYYSVTNDNGDVLAYGGQFGSSESEVFCIGTTTCEDGIQNGDETGVDCGGSCPTVCPPQACTDNEVTVSVYLDAYLNETDWTITDANGTVVASGGPYGQHCNVETVCLPDGCYTYTIYDDYGDGICCNYGYGYYSLSDANGGSLGCYWGNFGASESQTFCVGGSNKTSGLNTDAIAAEFNLSLSPVPTSSVLNVNYTSTVVGDTKVTIYDLTGKERQSFTAYTNQGVNSMMYNVESLNEGMYLLSIEVAGTVFSEKFTKLK